MSPKCLLHGPLRLARGVGAWLLIWVQHGGEAPDPESLSMKYPKRSQYKYAKSRYRVRNWLEYETGLRRRGDLTVWLSDAALDSWRALPSGKPGGLKIPWGKPRARFESRPGHVCLRGLTGEGVFRSGDFLSRFYLVLIPGSPPCSHCNILSP